MRELLALAGRWLTPAFWLAYFVAFVLAMNAATAATVINEGNDYIFAGYDGGEPDGYFKVVTPTSSAACAAYAAFKNASQANVRWSAPAGSQGSTVWGVGELGDAYSHQCTLFRYAVNSGTPVTETGFTWVYMVAEPSRDVLANSSIDALQVLIVLGGCLLLGVGFLAGQQR